MLQPEAVGGVKVPEDSRKDASKTKEKEEVTVTDLRVIGLGDH